MKKIIAIILAVLALGALAVSSFAAGSAEQDAAAPAAEKTSIEAALTEEQALAAALKAAGEKEADVTVTQNRLSEKETTDGETVAVYTVKFSTGTTTCKYILDANTGEIYYSSVEFQNPDVIFRSRSRGEDRGDATGEMDADAATGATPRNDGRRGSGQGASEEAAVDPAAA